MTETLPQWLLDLAAQTARLTGVTSGFVPVVVLVPVEMPWSAGDVVNHANGNVEIRPPTATMSGDAQPAGGK